MCQSKAQGGKRCPHWYKERVAAHERTFQKSNEAVAKQIAVLKELEPAAQAEMKKLEKAKFFTNVTREKERLDNKVRHVKSNLQKERDKLKDLKAKSGDNAYKLEEAYENLEVINEVDNSFVADKLGNAVCVGEFSGDSQEWHDQRSRGYGGSDIASILGIHGAKQSYKELFRLKTGEHVAKPGSAGAAKIGHQFEPIVLRRFAERHPDKKVLVSKASWINKDRDYQLTNVDGLICENGSETPNAILEIKTSSNPDDWKDKVTGEAKVPDYYRTQVLWYMSTFGIKKGYLAAIINHNEYMEFEIVAKPGEVGNIHKKVQEFRDKVAQHNKVVPEAA